MGGIRPILLVLFFNVWIWPCATFAQTNISFTTLVVFAGTNGANPYAGLIQGSDGNFYGTTSYAGQYSYSYGTVFQMTPSGTLNTLVGFNSASTNGYRPEAPLIQGTDGNFYGTTQRGGTNIAGQGTVFRITTNGAITYLVSFVGTNGANVQAGLVQGTDGNVYGITINGGFQSYGNKLGTVFKATLDGTLTILYEFGADAGSYGALPDGGLVEGKDGNFYGTTEFTSDFGGVSGYGTIFEINTNGVLNTLFIFGSTNGSFPVGPLVLGHDGNFYGMTERGGTNNLGTLFRFSTNGILTSLVSFDAFNVGNGIPFAPTYGPLVLATDGNFYGTTPSGGANGMGSIFMMTPNGTLTAVYSFIGGTNGANPTGLTQASDGNFYGTTTLTSEDGSGGGVGNGTIFRISIPIQPVFQSIAQTNGTLTLVWDSVAGQSYQLQYTTDFTSANWTDLSGTNTASSGTMSATDVIGSDNQRFYRVVLLPAP